MAISLQGTTGLSPMCPLFRGLHATITHTHTLAHNTTYTKDGLFPLIVASQEGHDRIVKILIQAGTTVDLQNKV